MADLNTLRPEVREALDGLSYFLTGTHNHNDFYIIRAELLRLADENAIAKAEIRTLRNAACDFAERAEKAEAEFAAALKANRDCVDHFEQMQDDLAALKARIAESCRADGQRVFDLLCLPIEYGGKLALVPVDD